MSELVAAKHTPAELEAALTARSRRHMLGNDGARVAWREWHSTPSAPGPFSRSTLVLLHGGFGSWRHWYANLEALSHGTRVLCVDLPGLGDSDVVDDAVDATSIARQVVMGIDALIAPEERMAIVGFSFGGIIGGHVAQQIEAASNHDLAAMVVVGSNGLGLPVAQPTMHKRTKGMSEAEVERTHRLNLLAMMLRNEDRADAMAVYLQNETTRRARSRSGKIPFSDTLAQALPRLRTPVHGIWGAEDALVGQHMAVRRQLFEALPAFSGFTEIPGAGHWVMYDAPELFNAALRRCVR